MGPENDGFALSMTLLPLCGVQILARGEQAVLYRLGCPSQNVGTNNTIKDRDSCSEWGGRR